MELGRRYHLTVGTSHAGVVLLEAMALTVVRPGVDVPGDVADYVTLT